jgi:signal transduction histidine kinase
MLATLANVVARMKGLLEQLHAEKDNGADHGADHGADNGADASMNNAVDHGAPPARLAISPLLERVAADWRRQLDDLEVDLGGDPAIQVAGDEDRLVSVLNHLLANAVEAAGTDGSVRLRLSRAGDEAIMAVEDDGPGMDSAFIRNHLFRPFDSTKSSGLGIGAYQTRQLVREMGGRLEVESTPGAGTVMRIALPVAAATGPTPASDEVTNR